MAKSILLTPEQINFIKKNRLKIPASAMAEKWGISKGVVQRYMKRNGLSVSKKRVIKFRAMGMTGKTTSTPEIDQFLIDTYLSLPEKMIASLLIKSGTFVRVRLRQLGLVKPRWLINQFRRESQIKKGDIPTNKGKKLEEFMSAEAIERSKAGRFKKGQKSHTELNDGDITVRHSMPYKGGRPHYYIRIGKGQWKELQIYKWEQINGPIPKTHVLACKGHNTLNCDPSNWYLLTKADNAIRNAGHDKMDDRYVARYLAGKKHKHLKDVFLKHKDLIDLKRQQFILNRTINGKRKESATDQRNA